MTKNTTYRSRLNALINRAPRITIYSMAYADAVQAQYEASRATDLAAMAAKLAQVQTAKRTMRSALDYARYALAMMKKHTGKAAQALHREARKALAAYYTARAEYRALIGA